MWLHVQAKVHMGAGSLICKGAESQSLRLCRLNGLSTSPVCHWSEERAVASVASSQNRTEAKIRPLG